MKGKLSKSEVQKKVTELLDEKGVSRGVWSVKGGQLRLLLRGRVINFVLPQRPTYDNVQALLRDVAGAADELLYARSNRNQIDLEEAIAATP